MCGRFSLTASDEGLISYFGLARGLTLEPRYNIAPTQPVAVVRVEDGERLRGLLQPAAGMLEMYAVSSSSYKSGPEGEKHLAPAGPESWRVSVDSGGRNKDFMGE